MLKYLAILDYLNNSHDDYESGWHCLWLPEWNHEGSLLVAVEDDLIRYELLHPCTGDVCEEG